MNNINKRHCRCYPGDITLYDTVIIPPCIIDNVNTLTQNMIKRDNMKYIIKYNFDLGGERIIMPENCILEFDGGKLSNGTLVGNNTILIYYQDRNVVLQDVILEGTFISKSMGYEPPIKREDLEEGVQESLSKADSAIQHVKTINGQSIEGEGNIDVVADISGKADKATTLAGYGITDAYTKNEADAIAIAGAAAITGGSTKTIKNVDDYVSTVNENLDTLKGGSDTTIPTINAAIASEVSRATIAEELLQEQYNALTQSDKIIGSLPESGHKDIIYRVPGTNSYSDYMWDGTQFVKMAEYDNAIDDEPTVGSNNLVKSGAVAGIQTEIDGVTKREVTFTSSFTDYYVHIGNATHITIKAKNINTHDAYLRVNYVDDNDQVIASAGDWPIAQGDTKQIETPISQILGATKIKFSQVYGNSFEIEVDSDDSLIAKINKNAADILAVDVREQSFEQSTNENIAQIAHLISDIEVPTDKYGYINANGAISNQTSGNNHRTDYVSVNLGDIIYYKGSYSYGGFPAVYGYDANKEPIEQLLATGSNIEETIKIVNSNIKYIVAWGDISAGSLKVIKKCVYNLKTLGAYEIVDANGNGDYTTLEDAIWGNISDRGDVSKHRTIVVMPGTYTMNTYYGNTARFWEVISNRNLSIIGVDRNACILKNTKGKYVAGSNRIDDACLKLSGNVLIKNLTLLASHENFDGAEGTEPLAYCIHLDSGGTDCNLEIDNCIMSNKQQACIGIGTADNYTIQIRNCKMVTHVDSPEDFGSWSGAIICHNANYINPATLRIENNVMRSNTPNTFTIARSGSYTSSIKLEAYRNIIGGNVSIDSGIVMLDDLCYGNNKSELNNQ